MQNVRSELLAGAALGAAMLMGFGLSSPPAQAGPVLEFSPGPKSTQSIDLSLGWSFMPTQAITVTALDAFDPTGNGTAGAVRLYNGSGTVLASATVTTSDPQEGSPVLFYSHAITPVLLTANTTYFIAEDTAGGFTHFYDSVTSLTTSPAISYDGEVSAEGQGHNPTTNVLSGSNPGLFGPNFDIAVVPAPVIGHGLLVFLAVGGVLFGSKLLERRREARLQSG